MQSPRVTRQSLLPLHAECGDVKTRLQRSPRECVTVLPSDVFPRACQRVLLRPHVSEHRAAKSTRHHRAAAMPHRSCRVAAASQLRGVHSLAWRIQKRLCKCVIQLLIYTPEQGKAAGPKLVALRHARERRWLQSTFLTC